MFGCAKQALPYHLMQGKRAETTSLRMEQEAKAELEQLKKNNELLESRRDALEQHAREIEANLLQCEAKVKRLGVRIP